MSDSNDFKGKAGTFASRAAGMARGLAARTKQLGRAAKLNMDIASEKDAIRRTYEEMGRLYYENHRDAPEGLLAHACQSIDASMAAIAAMEEEIEQLREKGEETPAEDFQTVVDQTEAEAVSQEPEEESEEPDIEVEIEIDPSSDASGEGLEIEIEVPAEEEPAEEEPVEESAGEEFLGEESAEEEPAEEEFFEEEFVEEAPTEEPAVEEEFVPQEEDAAEEPFGEEAPEEIPAEDEPVEPAIEE
ncbi:MAG: hypothetical protein LUC89_03175 [Oscillospiraceae bacterium]|nr:hypothetical protein [Oscillospiraceae bacterium]